MTAENLWDVIIIGAGAGGAAAALGLRTSKVLMLDAGELPPRESELPEKPIYQTRSSHQGLSKMLLGDDFESLWDLGDEKISPKLKAPGMRYLLKRPEMLPHDEERGFQAVQSFAKGGLANAWGAGLLRYTDRDLKGFPITEKDLEPAYDILTDHIGLQGADDDLSWYLGSTRGLYEPFPLSPLCRRFSDTYKKRAASLNDRGIYAGHLRSCVLSHDHRARRAFRSFGRDFYASPNEGIYSPAFTIEELVAQEKLTYQSGYLVLRFEERSDHVRVHAKALDTGHDEVFSAKRVLLAAGAINTARLVLQSRNDYETRLPILDNPVTFIPFIDIGMIGSQLPVHSFIGGELLFLFPTENPDRPVQGTLYSLAGPLRTDLLREFPLSLSGNLAATKYLVPALVMLQLFYPDAPSSEAYLKLIPSGGLQIHHTKKRSQGMEREIVRLLRSFRYLALERWCLEAPAGSSIHYAGTLPMRENPTSPYETDRYGGLFGYERISVVDAATFPSLPAKNHSFTLMANAYRIASRIDLD